VKSTGDPQKWDDLIYELTPLEEVSGVMFKREDKFAPLGYGCVNGSKLRQLIWMIQGYVENGGAAGLISGASVHSPQLSMGSVVADYYGIASDHVIGATNPKSSMKHLDVEMATRFGANFHYAKAAYNASLQRHVKSLLETDPYKDFFYLEYGVSMDHTKHKASAIEAFHRVGAEQVRNLPDCERLIIPSGSCNSLVSILYGLALFRPNVRQLVLVEIGPSRRQWVKDRLLAIQTFAKIPILEILSTYEKDYHDLHGSGWVTYHETMDYQHGNINFHPRYEGKVMTYISKYFPSYLTSTDNVFWIIASEGQRSAFERILDSRIASGQLA